MSALSCSYVIAQDDNSPNWDNTLYYANRVTWAKGDVRRGSFEFQTRYNNDFSSLEQWHLEYASTFLINENIEVVPDFRYTKHPTRNEFRPGLGLVYKTVKGKSQFVHQVKYQYDFRGNGVKDTQGLRYALFFNHVFNEKWIGTFLAGGLYEFGPDWTGFLGLRTGPAVTYVFNDQHTVNVGYFYGLIADKQGGYTNIGIPSIQLIINLQRTFKYIPAKYYSF